MELKIQHLLWQPADPSLTLFNTFCHKSNYFINLILIYDAMNDGMQLFNDSNQI